LRRLSRVDLFKIFLRAYYIQGSWNYERMLNLGFCFCLIPVMKKLFSQPEERISFLKRHLQYFNSHPYFASFALGATAKLEEQALIEKWPDYRPVTVFKERLCGPLGAIGDRLFWGMLKPFVAMLGVIFTLQWGLVGPAIFFIIYNAPHIYLRYFGIMRGYELGFDIVRELSKRKYERYIHTISVLAILIFGVFLGWFTIDKLYPTVRLMLQFFLVALATFFMLKKELPMFLPIMFGLVLVLIFSMA